MEAFGDILVLLENEFLLGIRGTPWDRLLDIPSGTERPLALLGAGGHGASWRSHRRKLGRHREPRKLSGSMNISVLGGLVAFGQKGLQWLAPCIIDV